MTRVEAAPTTTPVTPCGPTCDGYVHKAEHGIDVCPVYAARTAPSSKPPPAGARPYHATRLADVVEEPVRWLWPGRLPMGKLVVLDGDPSVGKSTLLLDIAARLTTGQPMPGETKTQVAPADVVLLAHEDGLADTIRPRLQAAGADVTRVHHLDAVPVYDNDGRPVGSRLPMIPDDVAAIEQLVTDTGAALVIVDVLSAHLPGWVQMYKDQDMRRALGPLGEMAARHGTCIVLVRHPPKSQRGNGDAIAAGGGSIAIIGVARLGLLAAVDPDDAAGERRVLAVSKANLGPTAPSLAFGIASSPAGRAGTVSRIEWSGATSHTANDLLRSLDPDERSAFDELREWIPAVLSYAPNFTMENRELQPLVLEQGWSRGQLYRIRRRLIDDGVVVIETNTKAPGCPVTWRLATPPEPSPQA